MTEKVKQQKDKVTFEGTIKRMLSMSPHPHKNEVKNKDVKKKRGNK